MATQAPTITAMRLPVWVLVDSDQSRGQLGSLVIVPMEGRDEQLLAVYTTESLAHEAAAQCTHCRLAPWRLQRLADAEAVFAHAEASRVRVLLGFVIENDLPGRCHLVDIATTRAGLSFHAACEELELTQGIA